VRTQEKLRAPSRNGVATVEISEDFSAWLIEQASALRAHRWSALDCDHLAEELEDVYAHLKRDLTSDLRVLLEHLLKLQFEPSIHQWKRQSRGWKVDAIEHRARVVTILENSRSLRDTLDDFITKSYPVAVKKIAVTLKRKRADYPARCPWSSEQILDAEFFPDPFGLSERD
jgi:hypothetical protein